MEAKETEEKEREIEIIRVLLENVLTRVEKGEADLILEKQEVEKMIVILLRETVDSVVDLSEARKLVEMAYIEPDPEDVGENKPQETSISKGIVTVEFKTYVDCWKIKVVKPVSAEFVFFRLIIQ